MNKMKRHLCFLLTVVMVASLLFSVNAFATNEDQHEHTYPDNFVYEDEYYHAKYCTICGAQLLDPHIDENNDYKCDDCGAVLEHDHDFGDGFVAYDKDYHVKHCTICGAEVMEPHVDANKDYKCDDCNVVLDHEHYFANNWEYLDEVYHVKTCACGAAIYELLTKTASAMLAALK